MQKRNVIALSGMLTLLLLGVVYAWSVFSGPLEKEFGWQRSQTSMAFSICMSMFCVGGLISGFLQKKFSSRVALWGCAFAMGAGFGLASRVTSLTELYMTYGLLVGLGVGLAYNAVLSTVLRWFPDRTGFISGLLMMAFGFGGMVLGASGSLLVKDIGWRLTFFAIGVAFPVVILLCSTVMAPPRSGQVYSENSAACRGQRREDITASLMLQRPSFWIFFAWSSLLSAAGLMLIAHSVPFMAGMSIGADEAALLAGIVSVCNGFGRVIVGGLYDKIGRARVMLLVGAGFCIAGGILLYALRIGDIRLAVIGFVLIGLSFGGVLPMNAVFIRSFYGEANYPVNFSMVNMVLIVASFLGPYVAGLLHGTSGSYAPMTIFIILLGGLGTGLTIVLNKCREAREYGI